MEASQQHILFWSNCIKLLQTLTQTYKLPLIVEETSLHIQTHLLAESLKRYQARQLWLKSKHQQLSGNFKTHIELWMAFEWSKWNKSQNSIRFCSLLRFNLSRTLRDTSKSSLERTLKTQIRKTGQSVLNKACRRRSQELWGLHSKRGELQFQEWRRQSTQTWGFRVRFD